MKEENSNHDKLLEATDYLEAVSTLKAMKNLFFFIILILLLATQGCFWLIKLKCVELDYDATGAAVQSSCPIKGAVGLASGTEEVKVEKSEASEKIEQAAKIVTGTEAVETDANSAAVTEEIKPFRLKLKSWHVELFIRICNFALILSAFIYSLTLLISLKLSLIGRLGGINHITRAVFISIFAIAFLLPWQVLFKGAAAGAIYTPGELFNCLSRCSEASVVLKTCMYLRFCGLWVLTVLLFLAAQVRTVRWARTMLRRLGIIA